MLKHGSLGDSKLRGNVFDASRTVPAIGKMPNGDLNNARPLRFRSRTWLYVPP